VAVPQTPSPPPPTRAFGEADLLRAVNDYRAARGLARWQPDPGLAAIARGHSARMHAERRFSHEGFQARAIRSGSHRCVENLAQGAWAPEVAVSMWRRSQAHHDNLLDADVRWAGVGVVGRYLTLLA